MELLILTANDTLWGELQRHAETTFAPFRLRRAGDEAALLVAVEQSVPGVVVVDMGLPEGRAFAGLATLSQRFAALPVIVLSEVASLLLNIRLASTGSLRVARKPLVIEELSRLINSLLDSSSDPSKAQGIPLSALLYLIDMEGGDCRLRLTDRVMGEDGALDILRGEICGAATSSGLVGEQAAVEMVSWEGCEIRWERVPDHAQLDAQGIALDICETMIAGVRNRERQTQALQHRRLAQRAEQAKEGGSEGDSCSAILAALGHISAVQSLIVVTRDGFVAASHGVTAEIDGDQVGAAIAMLLHGCDGLISELELTSTQELIIESDEGAILCWPIGNALLLLFIHDREQLGRVRVHVHPHLPRLAELL